MIGIYKITNPNKKVYIGQSINIKYRWNHYKNLHCKGQPKLYNSLKKYGVEKHKFEVLCQCSIDDLNEMERFYQDIYCVLNTNGLNCTLTASSDRSGNHSKETCDKIRESNKNFSIETRMKIGAAHKGKIISKSTREKLSAANIGRVVSDETRKKMSESRKNISTETRLKMSLSHKNISDETRKKISNASKGRIMSEETKEKISKSNNGKKRSLDFCTKMSDLKNKIVLHLDTGIFYDSAKIAAKSLNFKKSTFSKMLSGYTKINKTNCIYI